MKRFPTTNIARMGGQPVEHRRVSPKHMAVPKPKCRGHVPDVRIDLLGFAIGRLATDERLALEQTAETADLVEVEGCTPFNNGHAQRAGYPRIGDQQKRQRSPPLSCSRKHANVARRAGSVHCLPFF